MAATEKTFSIVGDIKKSTANVRTHSLYSFYVPVVATEQVLVDETILDGTTDWEVPLSSLPVTGATLLFILMDDEQDGTVTLRINGAAAPAAIPLGPKGLLIIAITAVTEILVSNDSGNSAGLIILAA